MTQRDTGGPAFPDPARAGGHCMETGMTLRDWFAGQALAGIMANPEAWKDDDGLLRAERIAFWKADLMLAEREKP